MNSGLLFLSSRLFTSCFTRGPESKQTHIQNIMYENIRIENATGAIDNFTYEVYKIKQVVCENRAILIYNWSPKREHVAFFLRKNTILISLRISVGSVILLISGKQK